MPADCVLVEGTVVVDEAMITGEPLPVAKTAPGALLLAERPVG